MRSDGELIIGTVVMSMPEYGAAKVVTCGGAATIKEPILCYLPYSDANCGSLIQNHIQDGSTVICMQSKSNPNQGYILTAVNECQANMTDTLDGRVFYNTNKWSTWKSGIFDTVINQLKDFAGNIFKNHANSIDKDVLPGDTDIVNNNGSASIHVGKYLVQMKGSPMAFIDVSAIKDQIRMMAASIDRHTVTTYEHISDEVSIRDTATSAAEAFGMPAGSDIEENWGDVEKFAVPFFRMQHTEGPSIDGIEDTVLAFPLDADMHTDSTEPPVLYKARTAISGERMIASAKGFSSIKTPNIKAVMQYGYNSVNPRTTDGERKLDLLTPYEYTKDDSQEETPSIKFSGQTITDAAINKIVDKLLSSDYLPILQKRMAESGLQVSTRSLEASITEHKSNYTAGPNEADCYNAPAWLDITDPVTGKTHRYFDSTSFISQEPDGSILICDGYGSEIRLSQGNIIISPALDLQLRPGRDMWSLVPRHLALDAQQYITINSNKGIYIRSTNDLQLAAATEGKGKLVLECDDARNTTDAGLVIRSLGNVSLTGHDLYIGVNSGTSKTEGRIEDTETPGSILIDAGSYGGIINRCSRHLIDAAMFTVVCGTSKHAALTVDAGMIGLYSEIVQMPAQLWMRNVNGTEKVSVVRDGNLATVNINIASEPGIILAGSMQMDNGNLTVNGGISATQQVVGRYLYYASTMSKIREDSGIFKQDLTIKNMDVNKDMDQSSGAYFAYRLANTLYQDYYVGSNCFRFPGNYNVSCYAVPGTVWQQDTRKIVDAPELYTWTEKYVEDAIGRRPTAAYPGWGRWEQALITVAGYDAKPLKNNYITNTRKDTTNG